ncbi:hypothetical protein AJ80_05911 [Polytolypa hystricis UAMH7299]|uniref:Cyclin N-terminal domain-containing protein n=1 Tax=Polytolypa hystricis (strain UAMH7299) TaxID=1447883 RepID=A0A2B7XZ29_POLH7|nr:hypothetical protein AJ80_05911 [Polytolypa hystricis UAMH7299]
MPAVLNPHHHLTLPVPLAANHRQTNNPGVPFGGRQHCEVDHSLKTGGWSLPLLYGLSTPPEDMNSVAVKPSVPSNYGGIHHKFAAQSYSHPLEMSAVPVVPDGAVKVPAIRQQQGPSQTTSQIPDFDGRSNSGNSIASYLQIPSTINNSRGSLADFAAQITSLFWFEKASKLKIVETAGQAAYNTPPLVPESIPTVGFRKWVTTILSTTQVSQNVILLALLFIYRLKKFNPGVRGKRGSEFRLMTIALMMGNKFLDDNTYTNKTWAEVSGISVQEIHIMEVEFLSNVRYNLFVTKEEWDQWHRKLGLFAAYFHKASRLPLENDVVPTTPTFQLSPNLTPTSPARMPKLPSPPLSGSHLPPQQWKQPPAQLPVAVGQPRLSPPHLPWTGSDLTSANASRKRSWDEQGGPQDHPAKKMTKMHVTIPTLTSLPSVVPTASSYLPTLPGVSLPQLNVSAPGPSVAQVGTPGFAVSQHTVGPTYVPVQAQLPLPGTRAMTTVYPPVSSWNQQQYPPPQQLPSAATLAPVIHPLPSTSSIGLADQSRRQSPFAATSASISPTTSAYSVHTPTRLSPTALVDRNSPYRPVRTVNTLLYPPPSASMQQPRHLPIDQMHYRPLGKNITEHKTGLLPYYNQVGWGNPQIHSNLNPHLSYPQQHPH